MKLPPLAAKNWRMCIRKIRYQRGKARSIADRINQQEGRQVVHAYCCPRCHRWHVGGIGRWGNGDLVNMHGHAIGENTPAQGKE
ncbi:MAG: hypothetical protein AB1664_15650 [Thermodesulfobacteriota bacterium]